jgi:hypothetical protein
MSAISIFSDREIAPNEEMLIQTLGRSIKHLDTIYRYIEDKYGSFHEEWGLNGQSSGWVLKLYSGRRILLLVVPCYKFFKVLFTLSDKAVEEVILSDLPYIVKDTFVNSPRNGDGRSALIEVRNLDDLKVTIKLIGIKQAF